MKNNKVYRFIWSDAGRDCNDRNDCSVRSLALALGIEYHQAHKILKQHGRKRFQGVYTDQYELAIQACCLLTRIFFIEPKYVPVRWAKRSCRTTPEKFCFDHPEGRFILSMASHFSVCIDGVIYDTNTNYNKLIYNYYEIIPIP